MTDQEATENLMPSMNYDPDSPTKESFTLSSQDEADIYSSPLTRCGLGGFTPNWLQSLRSKKSYVLVYGLLGMNQFCLGSYMVGTLSTMEKQYKISSRTSGILSSAWDVGTLGSFLLISYFGGKGHKTRWVAVGSVVMGVACFIRIIPYFMYGAGEDALKFTEEYGAANNISLKQAMDDLVPLCGEPYPRTKDCDSTDDMLSVVLILISSIVLGIGSSTYWSLGLAYLDDNVRKNKMPVILAMISCIRMVGPTVGFMAASYCLLYYVNPWLTPTITNNNSQWIGAWWMGWIPIGIINIVFAYFMALFPRSLPRAEVRRRLEENAEGAGPKKKVEVSFDDFKNALNRLWHNKIYRFNTLSSITYMFGMIGYWTYMPKYLEAQFQLSASEASIYTGLVGLSCSALGVLVSGAIISKFKPSPRILSAWNVIVEMIDALGHFAFTFMGCPDLNFHGQPRTDNSGLMWDTVTSCNVGCNCSSFIEYSPVCSVNGNTTFFSSCHAGCTNLTIIEGIKTFTNCSCIPSGLATIGACPSFCGTDFALFIIILCSLHFLTATGRAGNVIIQFRCVSQEDKSLSLGITEALTCGFAFIPGPIIYGALLDSSCLVWGELCGGELGNCWLYKGSAMRYVLNVTSSCFIFLAALFDIGVWRNSSHLKMYDDEEVISKSKHKTTSSSGASNLKNRKTADIVANLKDPDKPRLSIGSILDEDRLSLRRGSLDRT
uniref:Solute carrier organic anion transporter family member n=1 Tax=Cacopsylla melanoneura TaxID=428564 RepID=A0A8D8WWD8_9HEMI